MGSHLSTGNYLFTPDRQEFGKQPTVVQRKPMTRNAVMYVMSLDSLQGKKWCKINLINVNLEVGLWSCTCPEPTLGILCTWGDVTVSLAQPEAVPWTQHHHFMFNLEGYPGSSYLAKVSRLCQEEVKAQGYLAKCLTSGWLPNLPRRGPFTMLGPRGHDHNATSLPEHWGSYKVFWRASPPECLYTGTRRVNRPSGSAWPSAGMDHSAVYAPLPTGVGSDRDLKGHGPP